MANPTRDDIRDDLYAAMYAAITSNAGYLYRGRDKQPGPQVGLGTLTRLDKWGWIKPVSVEVTKRGQTHHEKAGGWLTNKGRSALRDEIARRGDEMPARLVVQRHKATKAAPGTPITPPPGPRRPVSPVRPARPPRPAAPRPGTPASPAPAAVALLDRAASRYAAVDPFRLIGTGQPADDDIPF